MTSTNFLTEETFYSYFEPYGDVIEVCIRSAAVDKVFLETVQGAASLKVNHYDLLLLSLIFIIIIAVVILSYTLAEHWAPLRLRLCPLSVHR
jgi:hypothetical protein